MYASVSINAASVMLVDEIRDYGTVSPTVECRLR